MVINQIIADCRRLLGAAALLGVLALCNTSSVLAATLRLLHTPISSSELPISGKTYTTAVTLNGSRELNLPVRAFIELDGSLVVVTPTRSFLDDHDQAVYEFQFLSPVLSLSYQFFLDQEATVTSSARYSLLRSCLPRIGEPFPGVSEAEAKTQAPWVKLQQEAYNLEQELAALDTSIELATRLRERALK